MNLRKSFVWRYKYGLNTRSIGSVTVIALALGAVTGFWVSGVAPALGFSSVAGSMNAVVQMDCSEHVLFGRLLRGCSSSVYVNGDRVEQGRSRAGVRVVKVREDAALVEISKPVSFSTVAESYLPPTIYTSGTLEGGSAFSLNVKGDWDYLPSDSSNFISREVVSGGVVKDFSGTAYYAPKGAAYDSGDSSKDGDYSKLVAGVLQLKPWSLSLAAGTYTLRSYEGYASQDKVSSTSSKTITISTPPSADTAPPSVSLVSASIATIESGGSYTLIITASDSSGLLDKNAIINANFHVALYEDGATKGRFSIVIESSWLSDGQNTVAVRVSDGSGNVNDKIQVVITKKASIICVTSPCETPPGTSVPPATSPPPGETPPPTVSRDLSIHAELEDASTCRSNENCPIINAYIDGMTVANAPSTLAGEFDAEREIASEVEVSFASIGGYETPGPYVVEISTESPSVNAVYKKKKITDACKPYPECLDEDKIPSPIGAENALVWLAWTFGIGVVGMFIDRVMMGKRG